jgi:hypothetical protein
MRPKRPANWIFVAVALATAFFVIVGLPRLGILSWIGGVP